MLDLPLPMPDPRERGGKKPKKPSCAPPNADGAYSHCQDLPNETKLSGAVLKTH